MKAIVAVDKNWGIGKNNSLLFSVPSDMKFFRAETLGKVIVVGRKTLESFPGGRPLPGRTNVVLTTKGSIEGVITVSDIKALMRVLGDFCADDVYVCGGASVYKTLLPFCGEALVTKIDAEREADVFFPDLDREKGWVKESQSENVNDGGLVIKFCKYRNLHPLRAEDAENIV
ncbi:MAG: dihydrofolate reductase [Clostridia bacterium]|nr:dihydrofolate reductase [Clostridia bacterium]